MFDVQDSDTYRTLHERASMSIGVAKGEAIGIDKGKAESALQKSRDMILWIGTRRFGMPSPEIIERVLGITDEKRLDQLIEGLLEIESWDEFWQK